ncbi:hypothetical protein [Candidatus Poriferisodalis sp.]|uniref:hypothetical protein n=1 Tax=Candidatus Poriferisodalis sp. TaxID=3101277 RepID=UPI003AF6BAB3
MRSRSSSTYYARRHTFTLDAPGWVTVDLRSDPAEKPRLDTYLVLSGDSLDRPIRNDDARDPNGYRYDSRVGPRLLPAGDYVAEATTYGIGDTGSYTLTAEVTAAGLAESHTATVGAAETVTFRYWPPDAHIAVRAAANEELRPAINANAGTATVTFTPRLAHNHRDITIRIQSDNSNRTRLLDITLDADCGAADPLSEHNKVTSTRNGVLCVTQGLSDPAPAVDRYEVTPGTLNGIRASAAAVIAARSDRLQCGLTTNKLAAFMLSIGYREIPHRANGRIAVSPARSPMTLGRADSYTNRFLSQERRDENRRLYSNNDPADGPARAFFHAGVGWWQIDDFSEWGTLNHGQRADTGTGPLDDDGDDADFGDTAGEAMAKLFSDEYCEGADDEQGVRRVGVKMRNKWGACGTGLCISEQYEELYLDGTDDLYVTIGQDEGRYSTSGGVSAHRCRWDDGDADGSLPLSFDCFLYDTSRPEGRMHDLNPTGDVPPNRSGTEQSPLAAPFMSFTSSLTGAAQRFAVFPGPVLWLVSDGADPVDSTRMKAVPVGGRARKVDDDWPTMTFHRTIGGDTVEFTLQVWLCDDAGWVRAEASPSSCKWVSVNAEDFAVLVGIKAP